MIIMRGSCETIVRNDSHAWLSHKIIMWQSLRMIIVRDHHLIIIACDRPATLVVMSDCQSVDVSVTICLANFFLLKLSFMELTYVIGNPGVGVCGTRSATGRLPATCRHGGHKGDWQVFVYGKALIATLYNCLVSENLESCSKSHNDFILDVGTWFFMDIRR